MFVNNPIFCPWLVAKKLSRSCETFTSWQESAMREVCVPSEKMGGPHCVDHAIEGLDFLRE
jgi:hypothetical protein